jgi:hypothetical protein
MRTSIWYRAEEQSPTKSGYYLSYRGFGMAGPGDYDHANGYMYYDRASDSWYEYKDMDDGAIVYYWTDATPDDWVDADPPSVVLRKRSKNAEHPAVVDAWTAVEEAIKRYETVRILCQTST